MENVKISEDLREFLENSGCDIKEYETSFIDKPKTTFSVSKKSINHNSLIYAIRCFYENDDFVLKKKTKDLMMFQKQIKKNVILFEILFTKYSSFDTMQYGFYENSFPDNGGFFVTINLL